MNLQSYQSSELSIFRVRVSEYSRLYVILSKNISFIIKITILSKTISETISERGKIKWNFTNMIYCNIFSFKIQILDLIIDLPSYRFQVIISINPYIKFEPRLTE